MSKRTSRLGTGLLAVAAALLLVAGPSAAAPSKHHAAATTIRVWTDKDRKTAVEKVVGAWASSKGLSVEVVEKDFGKIRDDLKTVQPETAPDVIIGAHDWTGQLAADGLVLPLFPSAATRAQFPAYALGAFSYGTAV
jgi:maltose-binding protein MalE